MPGKWLFVLLLLRTQLTNGYYCFIKEVKSTKGVEERYYEYGWRCCKTVYPTLYKYIECSQATITKQDQEMTIYDQESEKNFKYVIFKNSQLPLIPIGAFPNLILSQLYLNNSGIETIHPGAFSKLDNLQELHLQHNNISKLTSGTLNTLSALKVLDISFNNLEVIEEHALLGLFSLNTLILKQNNLKNLLPDTFDNSGKIQKLDLSHNQISVLPNSLFANLTKLQQLNLSFNQLTRFDFSFGVGNDQNNLSEIQEISLSHNSISKIESVPEKLSYLNLSWNKISELNPLLFNKSGKLLQLDLSENFISTLNEDSLFGLFNLTDLYFQNNKVDGLPIGCFRDLHRLNTLNLSGNQIVEFDFGTWNGLSSLKLLDISNNQLGSLFESSFNALKSLKEFNIDDNFIHHFNANDLLKHLKFLKIVSLDNNQWECEFLIDAVSTFEKANIQVSKGSVEKARNVQGISCSILQADQNSTTSTPIDDWEVFDNYLNESVYKYFDDDFKNTTFYKYFEKDFANTGFFKGINDSFLDLLKKFKTFDQNLENSALYQFLASNFTSQNSFEDFKSEFRKLIDENSQNSRGLQSMLTSMQKYFEANFGNATYENDLSHLGSASKLSMNNLDHLTNDNGDILSELSALRGETKVNNVLVGSGVALLLVIAIGLILNFTKTFWKKDNFRYGSRSVNSESKIVYDPAQVELM